MERGEEREREREAVHWWPFAHQKTLAVNDADVRRILILARHERRKKKRPRGTVLPRARLSSRIHDKFSDLAEVIYPPRPPRRSSILFVRSEFSFSTPLSRPLATSALAPVILPVTRTITALPSESRSLETF